MPADFTGQPVDETGAPLEATLPVEAAGEAVAVPPANPPSVRRVPPRRRSFKLDRDEVVTELLRRYDEDLLDRSAWAEMRLQRYAKLRGWLEPKQYPWPNAANTHLPVMMADSLRTQDTLVNAVLSVRPVMSAKALRQQDDQKTEDVDNLLDFQFFVEQTGEDKVAHLAESFVDEGVFVAFVPYVRDHRAIADVRTFEPPPASMPIDQFVLEKLNTIFPQTIATERKPFQWTVEGLDENGKVERADVAVYQDESDRVQFLIKRDVTVFDGPCVIPKLVEDVVVPTRCENLQLPSPSNPMGAPRVYVVDYPTRDEVRRLQKNGTYDLLTNEDIEALDGKSRDAEKTGTDPESAKVQRDQLSGHEVHAHQRHGDRLTRMTCYEQWDLDHDGLNEDVVFVVIKETRSLARARYLTELYPSNPPRRPFAEAHFLPVPGEWYSISLLELMESVYDVMKVILDQSIDKHTLANTPFFFYRAASGTRPETIKITAGEGYPVANPKEDVLFPALPNSDQAFAINLLTMLQQFLERETMVGELQFGRVPYGKASALRTQSTMQALLQQGDARPERILRRFFCGLSEVYQQMHELNQTFLPEKKRYRVLGNARGGQAYRQLDDLSKIRGRFQFDFQANVLNTNKGMYSQIMQTMLGVLVSPLMLQTGMLDIDKFYTLMREYVKSYGLEPDKFINKPSPTAGEPMITADEAIADVMAGMMPHGRPVEGALEHYKLLAAFEQSDQFGLFRDPGQLHLWRAYTEHVKQLAIQEAQMAKMAQMAQQFGQQASSGGQGGPQGGPPMAPGGAPMVQPGEMTDETMPTSGGGASA